MKRVLTILGLLLAASTAFAGSVPIVYVQLYSFNGPFVNGIPTYPYTIGFIHHFPLMGMCDDYYHDGAPGDHWHAYLNNLSRPNLAYMRFGNQGIVPYEEAGWLLLETYSTPSSQWPDMNYAVWHIFNPTVPINANSQYWINQAMANYQGVDYSEVWVVTPVQINAPPIGEQEFLYVFDDRHRNSPTVPEPGSLALLATGATGAFAALRRR